MSRFNAEYRLFFKKLTDIDGKSISSPQLRVKSFRLERDLLKKTNSNFEVLEVPMAIENGDVVGMYDPYGTILFLGIVSYVGNTNIEAYQIYDIFDDSWLWHNPRLTTIEETLKSIIQTDYQQNYDTLMQTIYGVFNLDTISSTNQKLATEEDRYVTTFSSYLYDVYEKYGIQLLFDIPYTENTPNIDIGIPTYKKLTLSNNTHIFRNFDVTTNVYETNKLIVYGEETGEYRETWYATTTGITDNPSALNRLQKIKTNIVFSDDDMSILKASSLRNQMYNHEITLDRVLNNNLLSFDDLNLGCETDIYYNGEYYNTLLTGYTLNCGENQRLETISLKFGLVRTSLTSKLYKNRKT